MSCCGGLSASKLRNKIDILTYTQVRASGGIFTDTWVVEDTVWSSIVPKNRRFVIKGEDKHLEPTHEITMRYNTNLTVEKRIRYGSRYFFIDSFINVDERDKFTKVLAREASEASVTVS